MPAFRIGDGRTKVIDLVAPNTDDAFGIETAQAIEAGAGGARDPGGDGLCPLPSGGDQRPDEMDPALVPGTRAEAAGRGSLRPARHARLGANVGHDEARRVAMLRGFCDRSQCRHRTGG